MKKPLLLAALMIGFALGLAGADPLNNWHVRGTNAVLASDDLQAVTWGNGRFVAVGASAGRTLAFVSTNGIDWRARLADGDGTLICVAHGSGGFVAVGYKSGFPQIATIQNGGLDGIDWFERASFPSDSLYAVASGYNRYVAVGFSDMTHNGVAVVSSNGFTWTEHSLAESGISGSGVLLGVTFANDRFVAVSFSPANAYSSPDGVTWTKHGSIPTMARAIAFGRNQFVVSGGPTTFAGASSISTSTDLETWSYQTVGHVNYNPALAFGGGAFVAIGNIFGIISYSRDLNTWNSLGLDSNYHFRGVAHGDSTFVIVGGTNILQSDSLAPAFMSAPVRATNGMAITITGEPERPYRLQAAASVAADDWADVVSFTNMAATTNFLDTAATNFSQRFYRVISP